MGFHRTENVGLNSPTNYGHTFQSLTAHFNISKSYFNNRFTNKRVLKVGRIRGI